MKVETFECDEIKSENHPEVTDEALALIESLGLEGQRKLVATPTEADPSTRRVPYRQMTEDEFQVYSVLCPDHSSLSGYNRSAIPLRVLQVAAHAQSLGFFEKLEVWDKRAIAVKDPILVGISAGPNAWSPQRWMLARWGEELDTFSVLRTKAAKAKRASIGEKLAEIKRNAQADLEKLKEAGDDTILAASDPSYYGLRG